MSPSARSAIQIIHNEGGKSLFDLSHFSSRYDHVCLAPALAVAVREVTPPGRLTMTRDGNKVKSMSIRGGGELASTYFRDIALLVDGSISLKRLAEMTELKIEKQKFPFSQGEVGECPHSCDSISFLFAASSFEALEAAELSWDPRDWYDDLSGTTATLEEIEEVKAIFRERGFTSVRAYLEWYLAFDVRLLLEASRRLFDRFYQLLELTLLTSTPLPWPRWPVKVNSCFCSGKRDPPYTCLRSGPSIRQSRTAATEGSCACPGTCATPKTPPPKLASMSVCHGRRERDEKRRRRRRGRTRPRDP